MGRLLYSKNYTNASITTPVIREHVEHQPAAQMPTFEKWNTGSFDPDSDEFFNSDDAVYEAFIDTPGFRIRTVVDNEALLDEDGSRQEMELTVDEDSSSSSSSESERGSPMAVGDDDPANLVADWERRALLASQRPLASMAVNRSADLTYSSRSVRVGAGTGGARRLTRRTHNTTQRSSSPHPADFEGSQLPITTDITPIPIAIPSSVSANIIANPTTSNTAAASAMPIDTPPRPVTPPNDSPSPVIVSPPPSVTPRLYDWGTPRIGSAAHMPFLPVVSSPSTSPQRFRALPNSSARVSVPYLASYVRTANAVV